MPHLSKFIKRASKYEFLNDEARREDNINCRKAVSELMQLRVKAGNNDSGIADALKHVANVGEKNTYTRCLS